MTVKCNFDSLTSVRFSIKIFEKKATYTNIFHRLSTINNFCFCTSVLITVIARCADLIETYCKRVRVNTEFTI